MRYTRFKCFAVLTLLMSASACNWLLPLVFLTEHKAKVPAEFEKLPGNRAAVVIWADQETLFDYPHVRLELSLHIIDRLQSELDAELVDGRLIEDYLQRKLATAVDPEAIGREFNCDMVIYLELLDFQIRDPQAPDFVQAQIESSIAVYDLTDTIEESRRYTLKDVTTTHPDDGPVLYSTTRAAQVRKAAYEQFAEQVARKFYDHEQAL